MEPNRVISPIPVAARIVALFACLCMAGGIASARAVEPEMEPATGSSPIPCVERLHASLLEAMKRADELGYQGRFELLTPALRETFDLRFMASKSIGRRWKALSEEDQGRWHQAFGRLITANYAGRFEGYSGQEFETLGQESAAHDTMMVLTKITDPEDEDIHLNYRMRETDQRWRIVDVYFNGTVSELAMRRSEYSSMLKREGFEELLAAVDRTITDLSKGKVK